MPIIDTNKLSKEVKDKYSVVSNSFRLVNVKNSELDRKGEVKDDVQIIVGDDKQPDKFYPQVKLCRWGNSENDNEVNFSVRLVDNEVGEETVKTEGDKIVWEKGNVKIENYDYQEGEGGYKFVWYLKSKPASNKVEFTIQSKGLDFFYQPPLNLENTDPSLICTETQCKDAEGNVVSERPENVVGSYAVYHSTKGGMNDINGKDYKIGKAFHIFRPHLIDANGLEAWGILHIENGIYSVEIPQDFLDKAFEKEGGWIKSNDTFGFSGVGGSFQGGNSENVYGSIFASGGAGSITRIDCYSYYTGYTAQLAIYNSSLVPVGNSSNLTTVATNFFGGSVSGTISSANYWLVSNAAVGNNFYMKYDAGTTNQGLYDDNVTFGTWPNPLSPTYANRKYSIYATYTPSGGGGVTQVHSNLLTMGVG